MATGAPLSLRYHSDQLSSKISHSLREFYSTGELCDIILNVGNSKIRAHRVVLAAFSPYFRDLFHQPSSQQCLEITLRSHLTEEAVRQLVDFCYTSAITVDTESADKILAAANLLQVKEVEKLCITFLAAQQALKQEGGGSSLSSQQPQLTIVPQQVLSSPPDKSKGDNSRELVCADTSGIGSTHTSPRQSSRPSSCPSGSGSVSAQPPEDQDLEMIDVKKEHEDSLSDQPFFSPPAGVNPLRVDYENLRSSMASLSGVFFTQGPSTLTLPCISPTQIAGSSTQQLLMKALTQSQTSPLMGRDVGQLYGMPPSNQSSQSDDDQPSFSASDVSPLASGQQMLQCHLCQQICSSVESLKVHLADHRELLTIPSASPYKLMSPTKRFPSQPGPACEGLAEEGDTKHMCGTCGKCFRDSQSLKFHRYNHVLRYQCNFCGKRFSRSWNLHRHRKTHFRQSDLPLQGPMTVIDVDEEKVETETEQFTRGIEETSQQRTESGEENDHHAEKETDE